MRLNDGKTTPTPQGVPMCNMGVDIAAGGDDNTALCMRYDYWFSEIVEVPGKLTPLGRDVVVGIFSPTEKIIHL